MIVVVDILKFILFVVITFLSCEIITNHQKRISYIGTLLICFSSGIVQYINSGLLEAILACEFVLIAIDKLLENTQFKFLYSIAVPIRNFRLFITFKY